MFEITTYITKENITFVLATIGSLGTIVTWIVLLMKNRVNFSVKTNGYFSSSKGLLLHVQIINNSRLPLNITGFSISVQSTEIFASAISRKVFESKVKHNGVIVEHEKQYSLPLPISLASLYGTSGYVYFEYPEGMSPHLANTVTVKVYANQSKVVEKVLLLDRQLD